MYKHKVTDYLLEITKKTNVKTYKYSLNSNTHTIEANIKIEGQATPITASLLIYNCSAEMADILQKNIANEAFLSPQNKLNQQTIVTLYTIHYKTKLNCQISNIVKKKIFTMYVRKCIPSIQGSENILNIELINLFTFYSQEKVNLTVTKGNSIKNTLQKVVQNIDSTLKVVVPSINNFTLAFTETISESLQNTIANVAKSTANVIGDNIVLIKDNQYISNYIEKLSAENGLLQDNINERVTGSYLNFTTIYNPFLIPNGTVVLTFQNNNQKVRTNSLDSTIAPYVSTSGTKYKIISLEHKIKLGKFSDSAGERKTYVKAILITSALSGIKVNIPNI